jgi:hypothetical protein
MHTYASRSNFQQHKKPVDRRVSDWGFLIFFSMRRFSPGYATASLLTDYSE